MAKKQEADLNGEEKAQKPRGEHSTKNKRITNPKYIIIVKVNYLKQRHIGLSAQDEQTMLKVIGAESVDQLISETMPEDILLKEPIVLSDPLSEQEMLDLLSSMAEENLPYRSYIGRGW